MRRASSWVYIVLLLLVGAIAFSMLAGSKINISQDNGGDLTGDDSHDHTNDNTGNNGNTGDTGNNSGTITCDHTNTVVDVRKSYFFEGKHANVTVCADCGFQLRYEYVDHDWTITYNSKDDTNHDIVKKCKCDEEETSTASHTIEYGACSFCGYGCLHSNGHFSYEEVNALTHVMSGLCMNCGVRVNVIQQHEFELEECSLCNYICLHEGLSESSTTQYDSQGEIGHMMVGYCSNCCFEPAVFGEHCFNGDTVCDYCGYGCTHTMSGSECEVCGYRCSHVNAVTGYSVDTEATNKDYSHIVVTDCPDCEYEDTDMGLHAYQNGRCNLCLRVCEHYGATEKEEYTYTSFDDRQHYATVKCSYCESDITDKVAHSYNENGVCTWCDHACNHTGGYNVSYNSLSETEHSVLQSCKVCSCSKTIAEKQQHFYNGGSICTECQHVCSHDADYTVNYTSEGEELHRCSFACNVCDFTFSHTQEHSFNGRGVCTSCSECSHIPNLVVVTYTVENNDYHTKNWYCGECGETETFVTMPHTYNDNSVCTDCDHVCDHSCGGVAGKCALCRADLT